MFGLFRKVDPFSNILWCTLMLEIDNLFKNSGLLSNLSLENEPFIKINTNPLYQYCLCQVQQKLIHWSQRRHVIVFSLFCYYHHYWEKDVARHLDKCKSPSPTEALCIFGFELAQWFWRRKQTFENFTKTETTTTTTTTTTKNIQI